MQAYSDETREDMDTALPDVEVFVGSDLDSDVEGWAIDGETILIEPDKFYYWFCFPGCLPDSEPIGPFDTADAAIADARS